jgi:hypothetical protein
VGFVLLYRAWQVLYQAQRAGDLATDGPYRRIRHPRYDGFVLIMFGFLLQWPTILTGAVSHARAWRHVGALLRCTHRRGDTYTPLINRNGGDHPGRMLEALSQPRGELK